MQRPERESRPADNGTASDISTAIKTDTSVLARADVVRCTRCHRPLTHPASVEVELGRVCRLHAEVAA